MTKDRDLIHLMSCMGKVAFDTYGQAKAVDKRSRKGLNSERRGPYHCPICSKYHLGHRPPATKAKRMLRKHAQEATLPEDD